MSLCAGSTALQPLVEQLAQPYRQAHPEVELDIAAGGSVVGIVAVQEGRVDLGMASRALKDDELRPGMEVFPIAYDSLAIIVHPASPVRALSSEQLREIYLGSITNWSAVGGRDQPIHVTMREVSSGTRGAFDELVLGRQTPGSVAQAEVTAGEVEMHIVEDPLAIGYVGLANIKPDVLVLAIDGIAPTPAAVQRGEYPLRRPLALLLDSLSRPLARSFVDALSPQGQQIVAQDGWVPIGAATQPKAAP